MEQQRTLYVSEDCLVEEFCSTIQLNGSPWGELKVAREFGYVRGCTDVIAVDRVGNVLAHRHNGVVQPQDSVRCEEGKGDCQDTRWV